MEVLFGIILLLHLAFGSPGSTRLGQVGYWGFAVVVVTALVLVWCLGRGFITT